MSYLKRVIATTIMACCLFYFAGPVLAEETAMKFDIPAQSLETALKLFCEQSGIKVGLPEGECKKYRTNTISGMLTPSDALRTLLAGTGLKFTSIEKGTVALFRADKKDTAETTETGLNLGEIVVDAKRERDAAITEGTKSYKSSAVTVAGKESLEVREIPNSLSVITRQLMDDRNMVTISDAMNQATGVNVLLGSDIYLSNYYSRGYQMNQMSDGMPGISSRHQQFDLGIYDRIEVIRGPFGLLQGSGNPSATINLVKKVPRDQFAVQGALSGGSWNNYYGMLDVTGPLVKNKSVRIRLVASGRDRDFFWDRDHEEKWLVYGIIEADLMKYNTISFSFTRQHVDNPRYAGNPAYTNGRYIHLPYSFNPYPEWNKHMYEEKEMAGSIKQRFANEWVAELKLRHSEKKEISHAAFPSTGVNPATMTVPYTLRDGDYILAWKAMDVYVTGPFNLLNRTHKLLFGYNYDRYSTGNEVGVRSVKGVSLFNPGPELTTKPYIAHTSGGEDTVWQSGFYGKLQIKIFNPLTVVLGGRLSDYRSKGRWRHPSKPTPWKTGYRVDDEFTKYGGIIFDVNKHISLYGSYSDIFVPQSAKKWPTGVLDPRVGGQYEIGVKGEFFERKLNASLALFRMRDENRAYDDPDHYKYYLPDGEVESKGIEAEAAGSPLQGLDITAGYTYLKTKFTKDDDSRYNGKTYEYWIPEHTLKLWGNYHIQGGYFKKLSLGAGVNAYSKAEVVSYKAGVAGRKQNAYAIVSAQVGYQINKNLSASLTCNNLFDKFYYARVGNLNALNTYGEPRNYMLMLRASF